MQIDFSEGPQLIVVEDQTGAGKTEAALMLAGRLMAEGRADGVFVALPTMATANAMYLRCRKLYSALFSAGAEPSIVLAHSQRDIVLHGLGLSGRFAEGRYDSETEYAGQACARWLGDDRRKAALADCGIGTVDQCVLAVLPSRFQSLRLLGLARKVLIFDEVHAHDAYLRQLVCGLLGFHAAMGGSAILLSATLPASQRHQYAKAFAEGAGLQMSEASLPHDPYPMISLPLAKGSPRRAVAPRADLVRNLDVVLLHDVGAAVDAVRAAAGAGQAVAWIRNSVADAMEAHTLLRGQVATILLFHARFAMGDRLDREREVLSRFGKEAGEARRGAVLIATQVAEQSLDLDFDVMVSDLAPMDALLQRAGRLWRHARTGRTGSPVLHVLSPDPSAVVTTSWYKAMFRRGARVYPDHAGLWLTARELQRRGCLQLPQDARALIEAVYGEVAGEEIPEALASSRSRAEGEAVAATQTGEYALLPLKEGYPAAVRKWENDMRVATRLGEQVSLIRLARWDGRGLRPWCGGEGWLAWRLSEVSVMRYRVAAVPTPGDPTLAASVDQVRGTWPEYAQDTLLLPLMPAGDGSGRWIGRAIGSEGRSVNLFYDTDCGLQIE
jgi:CRISPR-associated endonuclease/helicase Cas3